MLHSVILIIIGFANGLEPVGCQVEGGIDVQS